MIKVNPSKDYADSAFRCWAIRGCISYDDAIKELKRKHDDTQEQERALEEASAELLDILACEETFRRLNTSGKAVICDAVRAVYMVHPGRIPKAKEITERVAAFACENYIGERQVNRYLAEAREVFARVRGVRWR